MNTVLKILIALAAAPAVPLLLLVEWLRISMGRVKPPSETVVVCYSQVIWDEVWQRPQQYSWLTSQEQFIVYCCPVQLHNLLTLKRRWRPVRDFRAVGRKLVVLSPLIFSGHFKSRILHELNCRITALHLKLWLRKTSQIYMIVNTPFALPVVRAVGWQEGRRRPEMIRLVFDVIDDFTAFEWAPGFGKAFDSDLTNLADRIITGTHELAHARPTSVFVPCGVDFELFATSAPAPPEIASLPRPILGYFGTISERVDILLIEKLADRFPQASLVMIGPIHLNLKDLPVRPNIYYLGLMEHKRLPGFAQQFSAALIPFAITPATIKLNPVKTLEYLAAGIPVVATRIPDLERFYSKVIYVAADHKDFLQHVDDILKQPNSDKHAEGLELARSASWNQMVTRMNEALAVEPAAGEPR